MYRRERATNLLIEELNESHKTHDDPGNLHLFAKTITYIDKVMVTIAVPVAAMATMAGGGSRRSCSSSSSSSGGGGNGGVSIAGSSCLQ